MVILPSGLMFPAATMTESDRELLWDQERTFNNMMYFEELEQFIAVREAAGEVEAEVEAEETRRRRRVERRIEARERQRREILAARERGVPSIWGTNPGRLLPRRMPVSSQAQGVQLVRADYNREDILPRGLPVLSQTLEVPLLVANDSGEDMSDDEETRLGSHSDSSSDSGTNMEDGWDAQSESSWESDESDESSDEEEDSESASSGSESEWDYR